MARSLTTARRSLLVLAHRGAHGREPENSLAAFAEALALGADGIEVDVRATSDGMPVCFHDWYLKRLTGHSGRLSRTTIHRLLECPIVHPRTRRKRPVATLSEVLTLAGDQHHIVLDLKQETVRSTSLETETVRLLREHGLGERVVVSSFNPWVLRRIRQLAPEFSTALIASSRLAVRLYHPDYCDGLHLHHEIMRRRWFRRIAPRFRRLAVWTVDRHADLDWPLPDNVRAVITNRLDRWGLRRGASPPASRTAARPTAGL